MEICVFVGLLIIGHWCIESLDIQSRSMCSHICNNMNWMANKQHQKHSTAFNCVKQTYSTAVSIAISWIWCDTYVCASVWMGVCVCVCLKQNRNRQCHKTKNYGLHVKYTRKMCVRPIHAVHEYMKATQKLSGVFAKYFHIWPIEY